ncbi:hypothetical protein VP1G_06965 [Cytospora mali]|uniref:FAD-binding PCMH-type domain-containing protein n=1 Tax=Cytospora mali TaxID=578113 RepID=A0A194V773_CYTMA|nr:hypothetical protein VP1G_06965 [Valsa mali var. pyri (nom. inval.)]
MLHGFFLIAGLLGLSLASDNLTALCSQLNQHQHRFSSNSTIQCGEKDVRWSDYAAPQPGAIVTIGSEDDVAEAISVANKLDIPFLIQSGGNGWADTFTLGSNGVVLDVSQLKNISFNEDRTEVTFQTGVTIKEIVTAAWDNNARVATGTCNCVSVLGAGLGGGIGRGTGLYGLGLDQLISVNYVNGNGKKSTVTPESDPDLWWALGGAGANFGVVTSVVYKSYPVPQANNTAWTGALFYNETQIEDVVSAINNLTLEAEMQLDFYFTAGQVLALPFYIGSEEIARQKFASLLDIGPLADDTEVIPYDTWNAAGDTFCADGGRKPAYATNLKTMDPTAWRSVWNEYISFYNEYPEANATTILTECYSTAKSLEISSSQSAYPWRDIKCYNNIIPWYTHASLDAAANEFGQKTRSYLAASAGTDSFSAYINFAHGDEALSSIYGDSLPKLKTLKAKYDPKGRFNQWFPLS